MPQEFHGKFVLTDTGIVFVFTGGIQPYDAQYLYRQFMKCDVHAELMEFWIAGAKPNITFPYVKRVSQDD